VRSDNRDMQQNLQSTRRLVTPTSLSEPEPSWVGLLRLNTKGDALRENFKKISLYWRPNDTYWRPTNSDANLAVSPGPVGRYPLDFTCQIASGHFAHFDRAGLPLQRSRDGKGFVHNYTMMCGFALAHWERYLESGNPALKAKFLAVAQYILESAERRANGSLLLRVERPGKGHIGEVSSMCQGEAISVFCRAWLATGDASFLEAAVGCLGSFEVPVDRGGVLGNISCIGAPWYEEYPTGSLNHVLNGMIFALWGLRDLVEVAGEQRAKRMFETGVESVVRALPLFDNGFWSWYWVAESDPPYIASMMYHSLHVCQLLSLAAQTGREELRSYALRFQSYASSFVCRSRAIGTMVSAKLALARGGRQNFTARLNEHNARFGPSGASDQVQRAGTSADSEC
jgi:D-glucuronyl C5-epimerase C-terminus